MTVNLLSSIIQSYQPKAFMNYDNIMETFYNNIVDATSTERQKLKKIAAKSLEEIGLTKNEAKTKVQRWFEAIRDQQRTL